MDFSKIKFRSSELGYLMVDGRGTVLTDLQAKTLKELEEKKQIQKDVLEHWYNTREGKNEDEVSGFFVSIEMNWLMEYFEKLVSERVALAKQEAVFTKYELELIERLLGDLCTENWVELKLSSKTVKDIEKVLDKIEVLTSGGGKAE